MENSSKDKRINVLIRNGALFFSALIILTVAILFVYDKNEIPAPAKSTADHVTPLKPVNSTEMISSLGTLLAVSNPVLTVRPAAENYITWDNGNGYMIGMKTEQNLSVESRGPQVEKTHMHFINEQKLLREEFLHNGFVEDELNTSFTRFYSYRQAYRNGNTLCLVTIDSNNIIPSLPEFANRDDIVGYQFDIGCASTLTQMEQEQVPFLDLLKLGGTGASVSVDAHFGDFYRLGIFTDPGGFGAVAKREGSGYRLIYKGQEEPPCELMDSEQIPKEVLVGMGDGSCHNEDGTRRANQ